jgi:hypothetical protein
MEIKFTIDHDCGNNSYLLSGDYNKTRFTEIVDSRFFGLPLLYKKWLIKLRFKILYKK